MLISQTWKALTVLVYGWSVTAHIIQTVTGIQVLILVQLIPIWEEGVSYTGIRHFYTNVTISVKY